MDNRAMDMRNTETINAWLDTYVYSSTTFDNVIRYDDTEHQFAGVDLTFNIGDSEYVCDEKCSVYRMNQAAPTFAMSISQVNRDGVRRDEWFINDTLDTDSYMFIWLDKVDATPQTLTIDAIKQATIALVKKDSIVNYLNGLNWTKERINKMKEYMVEMNMPSWGNIYNNGCKWIYDLGKYREKSINLLIPRDVLLRISDWKKTVTL